MGLGSWLAKYEHFHGKESSGYLMRIGTFLGEGTLIFSFSLPSKWRSAPKLIKKKNAFLG